jgi:hypothetical protein
VADNTGRVATAEAKRDREGVAGAGPVAGTVVGTGDRAMPGIVAGGTGAVVGNNLAVDGKTGLVAGAVGAVAGNSAGLVAEAISKLAAGSVARAPVAIAVVAGIVAGDVGVTTAGSVAGNVDAAAMLSATLVLGTCGRVAGAVSGSVAGAAGTVCGNSEAIIAGAVSGIDTTVVAVLLICRACGPVVAPCWQPTPIHAKPAHSPKAAGVTRRRRTRDCRHDFPRDWVIWRFKVAPPCRRWPPGESYPMRSRPEPGRAPG